MLKIGNTEIGAIHLGDQKIVRAYMGDAVVFDTVAPPVPTFTITVSVDPEGGGTVSGAGSYQAGESVTVTAVSREGYEFSGWRENGVVVSTDGSYTFTVSGNSELTAVFELKHVSRLPEGYVELAYIDSAENPGDANAYCLTGIRISNGTGNYPRIVVDFEPLLQSNAASISYAARALRQPDTSTYYEAGITFGNSAAAAKWRGLVCYYRRGSSTAYGYNVVSNDATPGRHTVDWDLMNKIILLDGISVLEGKVLAPSTFSYAPTLSFPAGGNAASGFSATGATRLYSLQVYNNEELQGDFVPCKNPDGIVGLFDLVTSVFKGSAATNIPFVAGPAV